VFMSLLNSRYLTPDVALSDGGHGSIQGPWGLVFDSTDVRVEFHPVPVPRKLLLRISPMGLPRPRVPRPNLMRIEQVQLACEFATRQRLHRADEIAVNVIRMVLLLDEGAVGKDLSHTHVPELLGHGLEIVDEEIPPTCVVNFTCGLAAVVQRRMI
jgi:hypothetical protein